MKVRLSTLAAVVLAGCAAAPAEQAPPAVAAVPPARAAAEPGPGAQPAAPAAVASQAASQAAPQAALQEPVRVVEQFGVHLKAVRLTANGYMVDVRYRVFDPARAHALLDRTVRPVLVDETTGSRFYVPTPPIVGALRQTARNKVIHTDRDYFMLFANPERRLQAGSKVVLYLGDERFADLQVQGQADHAAAQPQAR